MASPLSALHLVANVVWEHKLGAPCATFADCKVGLAFALSLESWNCESTGRAPTAGIKDFRAENAKQPTSTFCQVELR